MADGDKRVTRSQSQQQESGLSNYLGFNLFGAQARAIRSPTPSPATSPAFPSPTNNQVFFPSPESRSQQQQFVNTSITASDNAATTATMGDQAIASLSSALSGLQVSSRKPDLPAFDKSAIEIWIRRVESAYIRAGISTAIEKFAFIESKFAVNEDPSIDKFLFGTPSDDNWTAFCEYLKKRYGKTTRQKVAAVLEPAQMDGRTPLQYLARLQQNSDGITLDDVYKEICMRQLPSDIQHVICKATESMNAEDMMKYAESFYNPDGSRLLKKQAVVNSVDNNNAASSASFTPAFHENNNDDTSGGDINAIRGRSNFQKNRQFGNNNNNSNYNNARSKSRGRSFGGGNGASGGSGNYNNASRSNNNKQHDPALCFYHNSFGDRAKKCDFGCAKRQQGNGQSPRQ